MGGCSYSHKPPPVKIIIKVNDKGYQQKRKKNIDSIDAAVATTKTTATTQTVQKITNSPGQIFPKTPLKPSGKISITEPPTIPTAIPRKPAIKNPAIPIQFATDGSSMSTAYRSPPNVIQTEFTKIVSTKMKLNNEIPAEPVVASKKSNKIENPILKHYITRLLGMSRASIEQLGVSSTSTVDTPSNSMINATGNMTASSVSGEIEKTKNDNENHIEKLKKFITDNHSFLNELEQSLKHRDLDETSEQDMHIVEQIWMKTLREKEKQMKRAKNKLLPSNFEEKLASVQELTKSILKNQPTTTIHRATSTHLDIMENAAQTENAAAVTSTLSMNHDDLTKKYSELAAHCTKRFDHLNSMIEKVRQEKQKLLEATFSSKSSTCSIVNEQQQTESQNRTEFLDFLPQIGGNNGDGGNSIKQSVDMNDENSQATSSDIKSVSYKEDMLLSNDTNTSQNALIHSKHIGLSRDSGICTSSRPVTASEIRDSPDVMRLLQKELTIIAAATEPKSTTTLPINKEQNLLGKSSTDGYEPLLKGIPKYDVQLQHQCQMDLELREKSGLDERQLQKKLNKPPPTTLKRYSPQLDNQDIRTHELSTIIEVDTPATSQLNTSVIGAPSTNIIDQQQQVIPPITSSIESLVEIRQFPTFQEYAQQHQLDLTKFDAEQSSRLENEFKKLLELSMKNFDLQFRQFAGTPPILVPDSMVHDDVYKVISKSNIFEISAEPSDLYYRSHTVGQPKFDDDHSSLRSSVSSLPDIESELQKRDLLIHPFKLYKANNDSEIQVNNGQNFNKPREQMPTAESLTNNIDRRKAMIDLRDTSHTDDTLAEDLQKMGIKWAGSMLRKTQKAHSFLSSSTSTDASNDKIQKTIKKPSENVGFVDKNIGKNVIIPKTSDRKISTTISSSGESNSNLTTDGRPISLREFFARELLKKSNSPQISTDDSSSLTSHMFRSLLASTNTSITPDRENISVNKQQQQQQQQTTQRTSTPLKQSPTATSYNLTDTEGKIKPSTTTSDHLFSGESGLSSVRYSNASSSSAIQTNTSSIKKLYDQLIVPNVKLNLPTLSTTSSTSSS